MHPFPALLSPSQPRHQRSRPGSFRPGSLLPAERLMLTDLSGQDVPLLPPALEPTPGEGGRPPHRLMVLFAGSIS